MRKAAGAVTFLGSFPGELPKVGLPEVAFAGRSNVGKSSAINALLRTRKAARVSGTPGRTQAINLFRLGQVLCFADLPGYGFAKVPEEIAAAWKPLIERYLGERPELRLVVLFVDASVPPQAMDAALLDGLVEAEIPVQVVATKADRLSRNELRASLAALTEAHGLDEAPLPFSGRTWDGVDALWDRIEGACRR